MLKKASWFKKVLFSLIALLLFFSILEGSARFWLAHYTRLKYGIDLSRYRETDLVSDNGRGWKWGGKILFRGERGVEPSKPGGRFRIITTGDSCCWGAGVAWEQTYSYLLEKRLLRRYGKDRVEVLNAGVVGYDTRQVLALYNDTLRQFAPDLVIHYGTGENLGPWTRETGQSVIPALEPAHTWMFHSKAFLVLANLLRSRNRTQVEGNTVLIQPEEITALQRAVEGDGAGLMLVEYLVVREDRDLSSDLVEVDLDYFVPIVRTLDAFVRVDRPVRDLMFDQVHPTPLGHALIAARIEQEIVREKRIEK